MNDILNDLRKHYSGDLRKHYSGKPRPYTVRDKLLNATSNAVVRATGKRLLLKEALELLGCTIEEHQEYLESKFTEGMTWENHGLKGWHIDHILPLNEGGATLTEEEKIKRIHYTNTQPLWAKDNYSKGNGTAGSNKGKVTVIIRKGT